MFASELGEDYTSLIDCDSLDHQELDICDGKRKGLSNVKGNVSTCDEYSNDDEVERSERHQKLKFVFGSRRKRFSQKHSLNVFHSMKSDHLSK